MDPPQTYLVEVTKHIQSLIGNQQHQEAQAILQVKELKQFTVKSKWSQNEIKELVRREISKYKDEEKTRLLCRNWVRRRKQLIKRHYPVIRNTAAQVSNHPNQQCNNNDRIAIRPGNLREQSSQCRQPEGTEFAMPNDNITRQAQFLDERRQEATREEGGDDDRNRKKIKMELNGCWVDVRVDVNSLRAALGLPLHDIFHGGIYNEYVHNETTGPDVEDTDHGAIQPPDLGVTRPPDLGVTQPTLQAVNNNDEDQDTDGSRVPVEPIIKKRKTAMKDATINSKFGIRLSNDVQHFCVPADTPKLSRCQLHTWATNGEARKRSGVVRCESCDVHLCIDCFKIFHATKDLLNEKSEIRKKMLENEKND